MLLIANTLDRCITTAEIVGLCSPPTARRRRFLSRMSSICRCSFHASGVVLPPEQQLDVPHGVADRCCTAFWHHSFSHAIAVDEGLKPACADGDDRFSVHFTIASRVAGAPSLLPDAGVQPRLSSMITASGNRCHLFEVFNRLRVRQFVGSTDAEHQRRPRYLISAAIDIRFRQQIRNDASQRRRYANTQVQPFSWR